MDGIGAPALTPKYFITGCVTDQCHHCYDQSSQRSLHDAPIFRLLLKIAVSLTAFNVTFSIFGAASCRQQYIKQTVYEGGKFLMLFLCFKNDIREYCACGAMSCRQRPYFIEHTRSHPNSEVKRRRAEIVMV